MNPFVVILAGFTIAVILERLIPRRELPNKDGWWGRAIFFNLIQFLVVIIGGYTWEVWLEGPSIFKLPWTPFWNGVFAYVCNTWVFYWWHLVRHENNFLWLLTHQFHHSPERIETITSFYKHPLEIFINSMIITIVTCPILGLDAQTNGWLNIFSALAEFFYHFNVGTPYWIGYFMQRPEMHLAHHAKDKQFTWNYGDLPIWDILGGTWRNPTSDQVKKIETGFSGGRETRIVEMMTFQNVLQDRPKKLPKNLLKAGIISLIFLVGAFNMLGFIFKSQTMKGFATISTASPLPFVFSAYQGVETFSTYFSMVVTFKNGSTSNFAIDHKLCSKLKGPYNRRNVIGAVFSHGPFFQDPKLIQMREQILDWGFCKGHLSEEFGITEQVQKAVVNIKSKTKGNEDKRWTMSVKC